MAGLTTLIWAGVSSLSASVAWLLQLLPLPFIALARWSHQRAKKQPPPQP